MCTAQAVHDAGKPVQLLEIRLPRQRGGRGGAADHACLYQQSSSTANSAPFFRRPLQRPLHGGSHGTHAGEHCS